MWLIFQYFMQVKTATLRDLVSVPPPADGFPVVIVWVCAPALPVTLVKLFVPATFPTFTPPLPSWLFPVVCVCAPSLLVVPLCV